MQAFQKQMIKANEVVFGFGVTITNLRNSGASEEVLQGLEAEKAAVVAQRKLGYDFLDSLQEIIALNGKHQTALMAADFDVEKIGAARSAFYAKILKEDERLEKLLDNDPFNLAHEARAILKTAFEIAYLSAMALKERD